jgi:hypothetical protein
MASSAVLVLQGGACIVVCTSMHADIDVCRHSEKLGLFCQRGRHQGIRHMLPAEHNRYHQNAGCVPAVTFSQSQESESEQASK